MCCSTFSLALITSFVATQVLVNQQNRDDRAIRLAGTMSDVFSFVEDSEPLKAVEAHKGPIKLLLQQITECGYFIAEYAKQNNFCQSSFPLPSPSLTSISGIRTAKYTLTDIDGRITEYENKLRELKTAFLEGVTLQTGVTVFRMMNVVQNIGRFCLLRMLQDAHRCGI